jgi:hypothetical protein
MLQAGVCKALFVDNIIVRLSIIESTYMHVTPGVVPIIYGVRGCKASLYNTLNC